MRTSLLCCALLSLFGCASQPITIHDVETVEVVRYETVPVPEILLQPCTPESFHESFQEMANNADLERILAAAIVSLISCDADKEAIRALK